EVARADLRDPPAVARATQGVKTLVSLIGRHLAATEAEHWEIEVQGTKTLVDAAREARVEHFIMLSALWSHRDPGPVLFRAKRQAEDELMQSGPRYTILRPSMFATGPNSLVGSLGPVIERFGLAFVPSPDSKPISVLTLADLADALLAVAVKSNAGNA